MEHHRPIRSFVLRQGRLSSKEKERVAHSILCSDNLTAPSPHFSTHFKKSGSRHLEIGFGMGDQLIHRAHRHPEDQFWGAEVHLPGVASCLKKAEELQLNNLHLLHFDVLELLQAPQFSEAFSSIWILFPDPWPKKKQQKRRLMTISTLALLTNCLRSQGELFIKTDWAHYAQQIQEVVDKHGAFKSHSPRDLSHYSSCIETKYARKALASGRPIHTFLFVKH